MTDKIERTRQTIIEHKVLQKMNELDSSYAIITKKQVHAPVTVTISELKEGVIKDMNNIGFEKAKLKNTETPIVFFEENVDESGKSAKKAEEVLEDYGYEVKVYSYFV